MKNLAITTRPQCFADVVGQETAISVLKRLALCDEIPCRSIFLKGGWGCGKTTLARIFARALNCEHFKEKGDVCNECEGCKESSAKYSLTYREYDSSVVGNVESVKNLSEELSRPTDKKRLIVFDETHNASKSAQNALLKMVEDGVPNTIFMFASTDDILDTLKSRSICLEITPIPLTLLTEHIVNVAEGEGIAITPQDAQQIAVKSKGHVRDAMSLLTQYALVGSESLSTAYRTFGNFIASLVFGVGDTVSLRQQLLQYPLRDIHDAISTFIHNGLTATKDDGALWKLSEAKVIQSLFNYIYSTPIQNAMKSEGGTELMLLDLTNKLKKK